eukprot:gene6516-7546_t
MWYLEYLPPTYSPTATGANKSPVIVFLHGAGENGDGSQASLSKLKVAGGSLPQRIDQSTWPSTFPFIVLSPQTWGWWDEVKVRPLLQQIAALYPGADTTRVYLTGLSQGGAGVWDTLRLGSNANLLAAAVPICGAQAVQTNDWVNPVASGLPIWAFHNTGDGTVSQWNSINWINSLNSHNICPVAKLTLYTSNSHDAWTATYNTSPTNPNNIYSWMLSYTNVRSGCSTTTTSTTTTTAPATTTTTSPATTTTTTAPATTTTTTTSTTTTTAPATTTTTTSATTGAPSTTGTAAPSTTTGSTTTPGTFQKIWTTPTNAFGFWEYRPSFNVNGKYPTIIHLHGSDGEGDGSAADLNKAVASSLPKYIKDNQWPSDYPFLVLCPQTNQGVWGNVNQVITELLKVYANEIDSSRLYFTGQGRGAAGIVNYFGTNITRIHSVAAMSAIRVYTEGNNNTIQLMVDDHLPTWWITNNDDPNSLPIWTKNWYNWLTARSITPPARYTLNNNGGVDSYTNAYNPANPPATNMYSWFLSNTR